MAARAEAPTEAAAATRRASGAANPLDVIGFNRAPFLVAPTAGALAVAAAIACNPWPVPARLGLGTAGAIAIGATAFAAVAIWRVYGATAERRWAWIRSAGMAGRWLNLTTGFDDSTATLAAGASLAVTAIDIFDTDRPHEPALERARAAFPPDAASVALNEAARVIGQRRFDTICLAMSAHETHGDDRRALFRLSRDVLAPGGRILLVEHLRDVANVASFGSGAWHFATRGEWLTVASDAGLHLEEEQRLGPWVTGFVFSADRP